jgi:hypothetical protein
MSDPLVVLTRYRHAIAAVLETHDRRFRDPPDDLAVNTRILDQLYFLQQMRTPVLAAYSQLGGTSADFGKFQDTLAEQLQKLVDIPSPGLPQRRDQYNFAVLEEIYGSLQELDDTLALLQNKPAAAASHILASLANPPEEQPPSSEKDLPVVPLKPQDAALLKVLLAAKGVTMTAEALEGKTKNLSERTIRERLQYLQGVGLVDKPLGNTGYGLTAGGLARAKGLPAGLGGDFLR